MKWRTMIMLEQSDRSDKNDCAQVSDWGDVKAGRVGTESHLGLIQELKSRKYPKGGKSRVKFD